MLYYDRIEISKGVDVNKTSVSEVSLLSVTIGIFEFQF